MLNRFSIKQALDAFSQTLEVSDCIPEDRRDEFLIEMVLGFLLFIPILIFFTLIGVTSAVFALEPITAQLIHKALYAFINVAMLGVIPISMAYLIGVSLLGKATEPQLEWVRTNYKKLGLPHPPERILRIDILFYYHRAGLINNWKEKQAIASLTLIN